MLVTKHWFRNNGVMYMHARVILQPNHSSQHAVRILKNRSFVWMVCHWVKEGLAERFTTFLQRCWSEASLIIIRSGIAGPFHVYAAFASALSIRHLAGGEVDEKVGEDEREEKYTPGRPSDTCTNKIGKCTRTCQQAASPQKRQNRSWAHRKRVLRFKKATLTCELWRTMVWAAKQLTAWNTS